MARSKVKTTETPVEMLERMHLMQQKRDQEQAAKALEDAMSRTRKVGTPRMVGTAVDTSMWTTVASGAGMLGGESITSITSVAPSFIQCSGVKYYPQKPTLPPNTHTVVYVPPCRSAPMGFHEAYTTTAVYRSEDDGMTWKLTNGHE